MSRGLLAVIDLGSFTLIGVGLGFVVLWAIDRSRVHTLRYAGMIAFCFAANVALSLNADVALMSSIHGILLPIGFVLLAEGLLRRSGQRLGRVTAVAVVAVLAALVWYFAYVTPLLVGRIITQNLGVAVLLIWTAARLRASARPRLTDRVTLSATAVLSAALLANVVLAVLSGLPRDLTSDAAIDAFAGSLAVVGITVVSAVVLPTAVVALLAVSAVDLVEDLRFERDCDQLTGLLNRRGFTEQAETALRDATSCALILADLDFFKEVNDGLGHAGGDLALENFAEVLRTAPDIGQVTGRVGGEEFAVLAPDIGAAEAVDFAESIRARLAAMIVSYNGARASLTASFGVATARAPFSLPDLMDAADSALYDAKANGRDCTAVRERR
ncbi:MAG TPA: GGDEF domain-containing protein [Mycobacterium sp.]